MKGEINVYQTNYGTYEIPKSVMEEAMSLTNSNREFIKDINDRRTNTYKFMAKWAVKQDKITLDKWAIEDANK